MIVRRSFIIKEILGNIKLRIRNDKFISDYLIYIITETIAFILVVYIVPLYLFSDSFANISLYIMYVLMWLFIFLIMEFLILISLFFYNKVLSILFFTAPFLINIIMQLNVKSLIYS